MPLPWDGFKYPKDTREAMGGALYSPSTPMVNYAYLGHRLDCPDRFRKPEEDCRCPQKPL